MTSKSNGLSYSCRSNALLIWGCLGEIGNTTGVNGPIYPIYLPCLLRRRTCSSNTGTINSSNN